MGPLHASWGALRVRARTNQQHHAAVGTGDIGRGRHRLEDWLVEQCGLVSGVELRQRSVVTTQRVEKAHLLLTVPSSCQVRYDRVFTAGNGDDASAEGLERLEALKALFEGVPHGSKAGSAGAWQFKQALTVSQKPWLVVHGEDPCESEKVGVDDLINLGIRHHMQLLWEVSKGTHSHLFPYLCMLPGIAQDAPTPRWDSLGGSIQDGEAK